MKRLKIKVCRCACSNTTFNAFLKNGMELWLECCECGKSYHIQTDYEYTKREEQELTW